MELHSVNFNGQVIVGRFEELEELCLALEEYLYDSPTYEELNEKVDDLRWENTKLKEELSYLKEDHKQRNLFRFNFGRRPL